MRHAEGNLWLTRLAYRCRQPANDFTCPPPFLLPNKKKTTTITTAASIAQSVHLAFPPCPSFGPLCSPHPHPLEKVGTRQYHNDDAREQLVQTQIKSRHRQYHNDDAREQLVQTQIKSRHFIIILTGGQGLAVRRLFVFIADCCFFFFCFFGTYRQVSNATAGPEDGRWRRHGRGARRPLVKWQAGPARTARAHGRMLLLLL